MCDHARTARILLPHRRGALAGIVLALAAGLSGAAPPEDGDTELGVGQTHRRALSEGVAHRFTVELGEGHFVFGAALQLSVDVVVTVYDAAGEMVEAFDTLARGPEPFQFSSKDAGVYVIEVSPFEGASGEYEITLRRAEPTATTPEGRTEQLVAPFDSPDVPGGVVAVVRHGRVAYSYAFGAANLAYGIPFAVETRTNIGSTSKQFTAFAIALLADRGALSLDDDVRRHIPELPDLGQTVTLRHLLTHTSGYREFLNTLVMAGRRIDRGDAIDRDEIIEIVQRQPELQNAPGSEWNYNNTGYSLLATVVERVGGQPFPEWMRQNVFLPLGMEDTTIRSDPSEIIERSSQGYLPDESGGYKSAIDLGGAMGAGGIYTTVEDLASWMGNLASGELGGPSVIDAMTTPFVLTSGKATDYGFGLFIEESRGLRRIQHGGADTAHRSAFFYYPDLEAGLVVLTNNAAFPNAIAPQIAEAFFGEHMTPEGDTVAGAAGAQEDAPDSPAFNPEAFNGFAGRYEMEDVPGFVMTFTSEDSRYFAQATRQPRFEMEPTGPTTFRLIGVPASLTFHPGDDGVAQSLTLHQNGDHAARRLAEEPWSPDAEALAAFAGRYYSEELETFYVVLVKDGALLMTHRRLDDIPLKPVRADQFSGSMPIADARFERNDAGEVVAMLASNGRTRGVRFEKVE